MAVIITVLYSAHDPASVEFVEANKDDITVALEWYEDETARTQYLLAGNPQPSGFPFVVYKGRGKQKPESVRWWMDEVDGKHLTTEQKIERMSTVKCLDVLLACEALGIEDKLQALLDGGYQKYWIAAGGEIDLNHPITQQALASADIDVAAVKAKILEMENGVGTSTS